MSENRHAQHTLPAQLRFCASLSFARRLSVSVDRCIDQSNNITILLQRKFLPRIESTPPSIINNNNNSARMNGQHQWRRRRHGLGGQAPRASSRRHGRRPYHGCRPRLPRASCMLPLLPSLFSFLPLPSQFLTSLDVPSAALLPSRIPLLLLLHVYTRFSPRVPPPFPTLAMLTCARGTHVQPMKCGSPGGLDSHFCVSWI